MKEVCVWLVALIATFAALRYSYQVWRKEITPALSSWIIFALGVGLSFVTYLVAERHDIRSGILNAMDLAVTLVILLAIVVWGNRQMRLSRFERLYLVGVFFIVAYGLTTGDAWRSNLFTQGLITLGYIPTIQNLVTHKRNTESFTAWGFGILAAAVGLYPALTDGNSLAALYAIRTIILVSLLLAIMTYYEFRSRRDATRCEGAA